MPIDKEDGNTAQWDKLSEMRKNKGENLKPQVADGAQVIELTRERLRDAEGKFAAAPKAEDVPAEVPVKAEPEKPADAPKADAKPDTAEIEIDGQKIAVDPSLAAAFNKAEGVKKTVAQNAEREALKAEVIAAVRQAVAPAEKAPADVAAEIAAKAAADVEATKPDSKLMISDPDAYNEQLQKHIAAVSASAAANARAEALKQVQARDTEAARVLEKNAAEQLNLQFYDTYPVLKDSKNLVDKLMQDKFSEVVASGALNKPLPPAEAEALKKTVFADIAAKATRELVALRESSKRIAPPPPPPSLVSSAPSKSPQVAEKTDEKPKAKYPAGSMSAVLAAARDAKNRASA